MKVRELLQLLQKMPPSTDVYAFGFVPTDDGDKDNEERREITHTTNESDGIRLWLGSVR